MYLFFYFLFSFNIYTINIYFTETSLISCKAFFLGVQLDFWSWNCRKLSWKKGWNKMEWENRLQRMLRALPALPNYRFNTDISLLPLKKI